MTSSPLNDTKSLHLPRLFQYYETNFQPYNFENDKKTKIVNLNNLQRPAHEKVRQHKMILH